MSIFQLKQSPLDAVDLHGVIKIQFGQPDKIAISTYLTRLDQALIVWGIVTAIIFGVAQSYRIDWYTQAIVWSVLSVITVGISTRLAWFWVATRNQRWLIYGWSLLVVAGLCLTDYGIFTGWGLLLRHLCGLWLGISAIGYIITGVAIQAQALILTGIIHIGAIPCLTVLPARQFFLTGLVMSFSLWLLAIVKWRHQ